MESQELIIVDVFCRACQIEVELIDEIEDFSLIEIIQENGVRLLHMDPLPQVQKIVKFHTELHINKEGIEIILDLLERLKQQNQKLKLLQDKLKLYE
jgi:hypothetical protein